MKKSSLADVFCAFAAAVVAVALAVTATAARRGHPNRRLHDVPEKKKWEKKYWDASAVLPFPLLSRVGLGGQPPPPPPPAAHRISSPHHSLTRKEGGRRRRERYFFKWRWPVSEGEREGERDTEKGQKEGEKERRLLLPPPPFFSLSPVCSPTHTHTLFRVAAWT